MKAEGLWLSYDGGRLFVLEGVDLSLYRGQTTMVLGRSGSGKTSLLKSLKGLVRCQKGTVETGGGCSEAKVAYIPQNLGLVRNMTALENVLSGALARTGTLRSLFGRFPQEIEQQARALLRELGLSGKEKQPVAKLSGGERQRVAIGRALMLNPELILADEFVSQLDAVTTHEIFEMVHRLAGEGIGFLITTHEMELVGEYADRVIVMKKGRILHEGAAKAMNQAEVLEWLLE